MTAPWPSTLRLRCPADDGTERHLAADVRLPLALDAAATVTGALARCPCGAEMVVALESTGAAAAREETLR